MANNKVLVFDTSLLVIWLGIPGMLRAGKGNHWNPIRVARLIRENAGATFVLPLATIIETGNAICKCRDRRKRQPLAEKLARLIRESCVEESPWAIFSNQSTLWEPTQLNRLANEWPKLTKPRKCIAMGDATIKEVADHYASMNYEVIIATGDAGLKRLQPPAPQASSVPSVPVEMPRRHQQTQKRQQPQRHRQTTVT